MRIITIILVCFFLTGCGGAMDYLSPNICVSGRNEIFSSFVVIQPYDFEHMKKILEAGDYSEAPENKRKEIVVKSDSNFSFSFEGFRRSGLFWIIPPIGAYGLDQDAEFILDLKEKGFFGFVINENSITIYSFDSASKKVVEVSNKIITASIEDTKSKNGKNECISIRIKLSNFQQGLEADPIVDGNLENEPLK